MKKLVLICGILASVLSAEISAMSQAEWAMAKNRCVNYDKLACQELIDNGLESVEECHKDNCSFIGLVYKGAGHHKEAIPYLEKTIALGNDWAYVELGLAYYELNDYANAKKYYEIGCNKVSTMQSESCYSLGVIYHERKGARKNYHKAHEFYKKSCDMNYAKACNNLGLLYGKGKGVKKNLSIAKQYYGKACNLGAYKGCDNYKLLNNQGVQ
ncbi:tetratricopeptide repeat protein [Helicobacter sp. T3_23-1056]